MSSFELAEAERGGVAIIGVAGRFPGAPDVTALRRMLAEGRGGYRDLAPEDLAGTIHRDLARNQDYVPVTLALDGYDLFDAAFFGYSPREAAFIDPQQRLMLECAWHAFEQAGRVPGDAPDQRTAVFASSSQSGYYSAHILPFIVRGEADMLDGAIGADKDYAATRIAYKLGLTAATIGVQTACSSSLVAVHLACQSLLGFEADQALVAAASIPVPLGLGYLKQTAGIRAHDGRCRPFDADSSGTVFGAAAAAVLLRRVEDAVADGDPILAVILGSAVTNDGARRLGFTAPGVDGQARAIAEALTVAGVDAAEVGYVECHGTGTQLGDPVEIAALDQAFRSASSDPAALRPGSCVIGSIKSNIGHLDVAAGLAGLIKAACCVFDGVTPATVNFSRPNPKLGLERTPFRVAASTREWRAPGGRRVAGVSSFGFGGANAHAVLCEAPPFLPSRQEPETGLQLLVASAADAEACDRLCAALANRLAGESRLADAAYTLAVGRKTLRHRRFVVASSGEEAAAAFARARGADAPDEAVKIAFLFPGQGVRHRGAATELSAREPTFRRHLDEALDAARAAGRPDIRALLFEDGAGEPADTARAQPAIFALEYALGRTLIDFGLAPGAMIGHSVGEYAAACLSGLFSLGDASRLVAARGAAMAHCPAGAMALIAAPEDAVTSLLAANPEVGVAAINAPEAVVVAGDAAAVAAVLAEARARSWPARPIDSSRAFHSAAMRPAIEPMRRAFSSIEFGALAIPILSTVTGRSLTTAEASTPEYWLRQILEPVRFRDAAAALDEDERWTCVEVGPSGGLTRFAAASRDGRSGSALLPGSTGAGTNDHHRFLEAIGELWRTGHRIDWEAFGDGRPTACRLGDLPLYPFARDRHWLPDAYDALLGAFGAPIASPAVSPARERASLHRIRSGGAGESAPPLFGVETRLAALWEDLLFIRPIGRDDDVFALGADSILILQFVKRARDEGLSIEPADVFETRAVSALAERLESRSAARPPSSRRPPAAGGLSGVSETDLAGLIAQTGGNRHG